MSILYNFLFFSLTCIFPFFSNSNALFNSPDEHASISACVIGRSEINLSSCTSKRQVCDIDPK